VCSPLKGLVMICLCAVSGRLLFDVVFETWVDQGSLGQCQASRGELYPGDRGSLFTRKSRL
jgi:hypothetical protein